MSENQAQNPININSLEVKDLLQKSNKKLKNAIANGDLNQCVAHVIPFMLVGNSRQPLSYKESLVSLILGAYQKACFEDFAMDQNNSLDNYALTDDPLEIYEPRVNLSTKAKSKIR